MTKQDLVNKIKSMPEEYNYIFNLYTSDGESLNVYQYTEEVFNKVLALEFVDQLNDELTLQYTYNGYEVETIIDNIQIVKIVEDIIINKSIDKTN